MYKIYVGTFMVNWKVEILVSLSFKQEVTSHYKEFKISFSFLGRTESVDFISEK